MIRFIFGWMISAWFFAEILIFFPSLGPIFQKVENFLSIPTHDQWNLVRVQNERDWLEQQMAEAKSLPFVRSVLQGSMQGRSSARLTNSPTPFTAKNFVLKAESFFASEELPLFDLLQDLSRHT